MSIKADDLKSQLEEDLEAMQASAPVESDEPIASTTEEPADESNPWADMAESFDDDDDIVEESINEESAPAPVEAPPVETTAEEIQTPEVPDQTPAASEIPAEPTAEVPAATVAEEEIPDTTPPQPTLTPEQISAARDKAIDELAGRYAITDDEADDLVCNPEKAMPRFAAKLFLDVFEAVTVNLNKTMPAMIEQTNQVQTRQQEAENAFYEANSLIDRKHSKLVNQYAQMYVQMNPKATREEMIRDVGVQVMFKLGIDPRAAQQQQQQQQEVPAPYVPAGAAAQTAPAPVQRRDNVWVEMADELMEDD